MNEEKTNNNQLEFLNPYQGCQKLNLEPTRFNTDCDTDEYNFIKLIRPSQGTMAITLNTLFHKLVVELKHRGIVDITRRKAFEVFVANCVLSLPEDSPADEKTKLAYYNGYNACYTRYRNMLTEQQAKTLADGANCSVGGTDQVTNASNDRGTTPTASAISENIKDIKPNLPSRSKKVDGRVGSRTATTRK